MLGPDQYMLGCVKGAATDFVITGGRVAVPNRVLDDGWVAIAGGVIADVGTGMPPKIAAAYLEFNRHWKTLE